MTRSGCQIAAACLAAAISNSPADAANRCVLPNGRPLYTDEPCEFMGARHEREVNSQISVVPLPEDKGNGKGSKSSGGGKLSSSKGSFQKSASAPTLTVCYDPANARAEVTSDAVQSAIQNAVALWNAGCNVNYRYLGVGLLG